MNRLLVVVGAIHLDILVDRFIFVFHIELRDFEPRGHFIVEQPIKVLLVIVHLLEIWVDFPRFLNFGVFSFLHELIVFLIDIINITDILFVGFFSFVLLSFFFEVP